ncbi:hypothetical protein VOLCADRAFT_92910 [Volvox carteri f. nagariensis]|uniref:Guanylate cyclase domain-containing protein n=1 Tax=Volvox carteri f. nagariensis TaxID=3068 RepID=D8U0S6_VOLCA|nr:uncharacterized protein VOLCADRAFT_92910 [Volvox carteri f. nagariensis]EFJ46766.1 hypothetical protein VOLCADRAFT_92910 [Volvox carteri f. nagariensis]|eukprot:XP_002952295.1 hypothetical protein VOLCADRAFT_92910 [Volvox carteri f. nagariensis]
MWPRNEDFDALYSKKSVTFNFEVASVISCRAFANGSGDHFLWAALTKITRDCQIDYSTIANQTATYDAFGLSWRNGMQPEFELSLAQFNNKSGLHLGGKSRTISEYILSWLEVWPTVNDPGPNDYWLISAEVLGANIGRDVFVDLTGILVDDDGYRFVDIPTAFRDAGSSAYAGSYSALPLWLTSYQLLYRRDLFMSYNISVPRTWDEALAVADKYGRGALGPDQPDLGFCFESNPGGFVGRENRRAIARGDPGGVNRMASMGLDLTGAWWDICVGIAKTSLAVCGYAHAMFMYIVGTMVQLEGPSHGTWFDPTNLDPLYGNPTVLKEALRLFLALKAHSVPDTTPCSVVYDMLEAGRCLMLWGFSFAFKRHEGSSGGRTDPWAAAYTFLHEFTGPEQHRRLMLQPKTELMPIRTDELDEEIWVDAGYEQDDVREFLRVYRHDFLHDNVYYELRIPGVYETYTLIQNMLFKALAGNATFQQLLQDLRSGTEDMYLNAGGKERLLALYQRSVHYTPPPPPPPPTANVCGGCGSGDSTCLWESLAAEVMDTAVKLHHRAIRELLVKFGGYESATEGDSFILAFHRPNRALGFALAAQEALLTADWPAELLASPYAATLVVRRDTAAAEAVMACLATPPLLHDGMNLEQAVVTAAAPPLPSLAASLPPPSGGGGGGGGGRYLRPPPRTSDCGGGGGGGRYLRPASIDLSSEARALRRVTGTGIFAATAMAQVVPYSRQRTTSLNGGACGGGGGASAGAASVAAITTAARVGGGDDFQVRTAAALPARSSLEAPAVSDNGRSRWGLAVATAAPTTVSKVKLSGWGSQRRMYDSQDGDGDGSPRITDTAMPYYGSTVAGTPATATGPVGERDHTCSLERHGGGGGGGGGGTEVFFGGAAVTTGPTDAEHGGCCDVDGIIGSRGGGGDAAAAVAPAAMRLVEALNRMFPEDHSYDSTAPCTGQLVIFRCFFPLSWALGLRVRMGLHCGITSAAEVQYNRASGRIVYPGPTLQLTKAVADAGHGGQITVTARVQHAATGIVNHHLGGAGASGSYGYAGGVGDGISMTYIVLAAGSHVLKAGGPAVEMYGVYGKGLVARAGHVGPLRTEAEKVPGVLFAPLGRVAVALAQVQDPDEFAGWGLEASLESHREMLKEAGVLACRHGGYLVPTPPGSFQAVFCQPESAVRWILELQDDLGPEERSAAAGGVGGDMAGPAEDATGTSGSLFGTAEGGRMGAAVAAAAAAAGTMVAAAAATVLHSPSSASGSADTGNAVHHLQRATAAARLSVLHVKGGVEIGDAMATMRAGGSLSYCGGAAKRAACLAANASWHEVLVSVEVVRALEGKEHLALMALWQLKQQQQQQQQARLKAKTQSHSRRYQLALQPLLQVPSPSGRLQQCPARSSRQAQMQHLQPLLWGNELRTVKYKGGTLLACTDAFIISVRVCITILI